MVQSAPNRESRISPSMVQSVFHELKANGYSDRQIVALSKELAALVRNSMNREPEAVMVEPTWGAESEEMDLSLLGFPAGMDLAWSTLGD